MREHAGPPDADAVLAGDASPGPWLDRWWVEETALRTAALRRAADVYSDHWWSVAFALDAPETFAALRHPVAGMLGRSLLDYDRPLDPDAVTSAYPMAMAMLVEAGEVRPDRVSGCAYLPGSRVAPPGARPLPVIGEGSWTIEINACDPLLARFADPRDDLSTTRAAWAGVGAAAGQVLRRAGSDAAASVAALTQVLVPLRQRDGRIIGRPEFEIQSCSVSSAPGVVYASLGRPDPWYTAEVLVHEATHQLVEVVAALTPLTQDDTVRLPSPWKEEPRPPAALLHGIAAFGAVMRFWHRAGRLPDAPPAAPDEVSRRARQVLTACATARSAAHAYTPVALAMIEQRTVEAAGVLGGR
ncbi:HEXXH motif-containing putative peptide modification protein [Dactylosporangium sp. NPDC005555]|uniref:aKG-HExxH-type peptide beta-hydroxylase n=1 Tax=Dactylosporangium sp. NPDC005555 TaxID=3154889 RepID=UPI0033B36DDD